MRSQGDEDCRRAFGERAEFLEGIFRCIKTSPNIEREEL